ncbi:hypothetical protein FACS1894217_05570 [Clostridia bacterium]|nr:hypothetical protein FACS1894217_05570 [Clostridia bacterium]
MNDRIHALLVEADEEHPWPLSDVLFSKIFENEQHAGIAMRGLINAIYADSGQPLIESVVQMRSQTTELAGAYMRGCRVDVLAKDENGDFISTEVQLSNVKTMNDRSLFNFGNIIQNETPKGASYDELPAVTMVNILGDNIRPNHAGYHHRAAVMYTDEPYEIAAENFKMHDIELPKFLAKLDGGRPSPEDGELARWLYALTMGYKDPEFAKEVSEMDVGLQEFMSRYDIVSADKDVRYSYHNWRVGQMDERQRQKDERQRLRDAKLEGKLEGKLDGHIEAFYAMKLNGLTDFQMLNMAKTMKLGKGDYAAIKAAVNTRFEAERPPTPPDKPAGMTLE